MYKQARDGIRQIINANKAVVAVSTLSYKDNGFGVLIIDTSAPEITTDITCRISYKDANTNGLEPSSSGFTTDLIRIINTDYKTPIYKGSRFGDYEIGTVYPQTLQGKIIGYQAELKEAKV